MRWKTFNYRWGIFQGLSKQDRNCRVYSCIQFSWDASGETFESKEDAIQRESDIFSDTILIETAVNRLRVSDTDIGRELQESIGYLELLLQAYQDGTIVEKVK